jgi:hypothetical protein
MSFDNEEPHYDTLLAFARGFALSRCNQIRLSLQHTSVEGAAEQCRVITELASFYLTSKACRLNT